MSLTLPEQCGQQCSASTEEQKQNGRMQEEGKCEKYVTNCSLCYWLWWYVRPRRKKRNQQCICSLFDGKRCPCISGMAEMGTHQTDGKLLLLTKQWSSQRGKKDWPPQHHSEDSQRRPMSYYGSDGGKAPRNGRMLHCCC